jgi:DNA-binding protein H-NS
VSESFENLEDMNEGQLRELIQRAQDMIRERGAKRLDELQQLAREAGYEVTLTKIGEGDGRRRKGRPARGQEREIGQRRKPVEAKYRNPENPRETWAGRGRKPKWVEDALSHGRQLSDLTIRAGAEA